MRLGLNDKYENILNFKIHLGFSSNSRLYSVMEVTRIKLQKLYNMPKISFKYQGGSYSYCTAGAKYLVHESQCDLSRISSRYGKSYVEYE